MINTDLLKKQFKNELGESLLFFDIWETRTGKILTSLNHNEDYANTFSKYVIDVASQMRELGFPLLDTFQIAQLEMDSLHLILKLNNQYIMGCLLDSSKFSYKELHQRIIPNLQATFKLLAGDDNW